MSNCPYSFKRFVKKPAVKPPPAENHVDLYWDADSNTFVFQMPDGTETALSKAGHTHVSSEITDSSTGGNGASDSGKLTKFNSSGGVTFSASVEDAVGVQIGNTGTNSVGLDVSSSTGTIFRFQGIVSSSQFILQENGNWTVSTTVARNLLAALGIPVYADLTAANAVLSTGDLYYDIALGVCRLATA